MLFQAIRSGRAGSSRAGTKVPAGLDCAGKEPRVNSATAPKSSDKVSPTAIWSVKVRGEVRTIERLLAGVLNSTAKAGAPPPLIRLLSDGVGKRFDGDALLKPKPRTRSCRG